MKYDLRSGENKMIQSSPKTLPEQVGSQLQHSKYPWLVFSPLVPHDLFKNAIQLKLND